MRYSLSDLSEELVAEINSLLKRNHKAFYQCRACRRFFIEPICKLCDSRPEQFETLTDLPFGEEPAFPPI